jgi:hypothetical protein
MVKLRCIPSFVRFSTKTSSGPHRNGTGSLELLLYLQKTVAGSAWYFFSGSGGFGCPHELIYFTISFILPSHSGVWIEFMSSYQTSQRKLMRQSEDPNILFGSQVSHVN